jgi:predicted dehydrogenase
VLTRIAAADGSSLPTAASVGNGGAPRRDGAAALRRADGPGTNPQSSRNPIRRPALRRLGAAMNSGRTMNNGRLGIGFIGSGFNATFHLRSWVGVRDADVLGIWSPTRAHAETAAQLARTLDVGSARAYDSITAMVADPAIDALWLTGPNHARVENVEEIVAALEAGKGTLRGLACEKPLARNVAEATRIMELIARVDLPTGYLENQVFAPQVEYGHLLLWGRGAAATGRPYLARAAEEHGGPHAPWFWSGELQGGGVLNDMMCHSALVVRHLLTQPGAPLSTVRPVRVTGHIASLKWTQPDYVLRLGRSMGPEIDYARAPAEDFASVHIEFETDSGQRVIGEATTSWSYIGAGLRLSAELLGREYSLQWNSLDSGLKLFFSREVRGAAGEDLVEKQNAEIGLMPVVANEAAAYGYEAENRHFVRAFLGLEQPRLTFQDGFEVVQLLMTAYKSAEEGRTLAFPAEGLETFVPAVASGSWRP